MVRCDSLLIASSVGQSRHCAQGRIGLMLPGNPFGRGLVGRPRTLRSPLSRVVSPLNIPSAFGLFPPRLNTDAMFILAKNCGLVDHPISYPKCKIALRCTLGINPDVASIRESQTSARSGRSRVGSSGHRGWRYQRNSLYCTVDTAALRPGGLNLPDRVPVRPLGDCSQRTSARLSPSSISVGS